MARLIDEGDLAPFVQALGQGGRPFASSASLPRDVLPVTQGRRLVLGVHMFGG